MPGRKLLEKRLKDDFLVGTARGANRVIEPLRIAFRVIDAEVPEVVEGAVGVAGGQLHFTEAHAGPGGPGRAEDQPEEGGPLRARSWLRQTSWNLPVCRNAPSPSRPSAGDKL